MAASTCEGQVFSQPFQQVGDLNYYTPVPGSQFNGPEEGWELNGGAEIVQATRPDGSTGGVLELPAGSQAVSAPVCVTRLYPTARTYFRAVEGNGLVVVAVSYAGGRITTPVPVAGLRGGASWSAPSPFPVLPFLGGLASETHEVRFVFTAIGRSASFQLYGVYVDPRMI